MEIEQGIIVKTAHRTAWVRIQQSAGCATCESVDSCNIASGKKNIIIEVSNDLDAKPGDRVEIRMPEGSLLRLSLLVYLLPVVALVFGALMGSVTAPYVQMDESLLSIIAGVGTMAMVFSLLKRIDRGSKSRDKYSPKITRILFSPT